MNEGYVILMDFTGPRGEFNRWKYFHTLREAREYIERVIKETEAYRKIPMIVAPILQTYVIVEVKAVTPT